MKRGISRKGVLMSLVLGFIAMSLMACIDDDDDNGDGVSVDGSEADSSGTLAPDETDLYLAKVPEDADAIYVATEEVDHQHTLTLSRVGGGFSSRVSSGPQEASMANSGENEYEVSISNGSDEEMDYDLAVWLEPDDVELELEQIEEDDDRSGTAAAAVPGDRVQSQFDAASAQLPMIAAVIEEAAIQEEGKGVYELHEEEGRIGKVTVHVEPHRNGRAVRFYGQVEGAGPVQQFATDADAVLLLQDDQDRPVKGEFWVLAEGGVSEGLLGQDTGTAKDLQLITRPGPLVKEARLDELKGEYTLKAY